MLFWKWKSPKCFKKSLTKWRACSSWCCNRNRALKVANIILLIYFWIGSQFDTQVFQALQKGNVAMKEAQKQAGVADFEDLRDDLEVKIKIIQFCIGSDGRSRRCPAILSGCRRPRQWWAIRLIEGSDVRRRLRVIPKSATRAGYWKSRFTCCSHS